MLHNDESGPPRVLLMIQVHFGLEITQQAANASRELEA
jgi:hypothetical protein